MLVLLTVGCSLKRKCLYVWHVYPSTKAECAAINQSCVHMCEISLKFFALNGDFLTLMNVGIDASWT